MKCFLLVAAAASLLVGFEAESFGQVVNGGFENWSSDCNLDDWFTSTICDVALPVTKTTTVHSGSFAVRGEVVQLFTQALQPILQSGADANGFPISQRYTSVDGFYRFAPVGGDQFGFNIGFYKGDVVIAQGAKFFPATSGTDYAPCSTPMTYTTADVPDRAIIQVQIIGPTTGNDYHIGSVMYLDDLTFGTGGGDPGAPRLTIVLNGSLATVSWPQNVSAFRLQQTPNLPATAWSDVPGLTASDHAYTFTPTTTQTYFRLINP